MKHIILLIALYMSVFADWHTSTKASWNYQDTKQDSNIKGDSISTLDLVNFTKYYNKDTRTQVTIETELLSSNKSIKENNSQEKMFSLNGLMIEQKISKCFSISAGQIPFFNDRSFFTDDSFIVENGNPILINLPLQSVFGTYKTDLPMEFVSKSKFGYGVYNKVELAKKDYQIQENKESNGLFFVQEFNDGMNFFQIDAYYINVKYLDEDIGDLKLLSLMYKTVEPFFYSNQYISVGYSDYNQKTGSQKIISKFLINKGINPIAQKLYPSLFGFEDSHKSGTSIVYGFDKRIDDFNFGSEVVLLSKNWTSLVSQNNLDSPYFYENRGRTITVWLGYTLDKFKFKVERIFMDKDYTTRPGSTLNPVSSGGRPFPYDVTKKDIIKFSASYEF